MRKLRITVGVLIIALGPLIGLLSTVHESWGDKITMMLIYLLFTFPLGGAVLQMGKKRTAFKRRKLIIEPKMPGMPGYETSPEAMNHLRADGMPRFSTVMPLPDTHMFEPQNHKDLDY